MSFDLGKTQIDAQLLEALKAAGVKEMDALELARMDRFGGQPPDAWISGLRCLAILAAGGTVNPDWGALPDPWCVIGPRALAIAEQGLADAILAELQSFEEPLADALTNALSTMILSLSQQATEPVRGKAATPSPKQAAQAQSLADLVAPPDPNLVRMIHQALTGKGFISVRRKRAGEWLQTWLLQNGRFCRTAYSQTYYLYRQGRRLFRLDQTLWQKWLYQLTAVNPASPEFRYLLHDCTQLGGESEIVPVARLAYWDDEAKLLYVSALDGRVYRLDGETIEEIANGDGPCVFEPTLHYQPYVPDYSAGGAVLDWSMGEIANWDCPRRERDRYHLLWRYWWLAGFFGELCPTKPILLLRGERGSGKSMLLRMMLQLIFGPWADVQGMPDDPDDFIAQASNNHIVALDNIDEGVRGMQDRVARLATGAIDTKRELYTTNTSYTIQYRCWVAVTARTPDFLQRDDLVDRLVPLPVKNLEESGVQRRCEREFLSDVRRKRNLWWGDTLQALNRYVADIRRNGVPEFANLRMADWGGLASAFARADGQESSWTNCLTAIARNQSEFLLESDALYQGITTWLTDPHHPRTPLDSRQLYSAVRSALFSGDRPDDSWPRSVRSFGRRLAGIRREVRKDVQATMGIQMKWWESGKRTYYQFDDAPAAP